MQQQANKHYRDVQFNVGDQLLVKLQSYRRVSMRQQPYSKLSHHFYGPFEVLEKIGQIAYRLKQPPQSRIHPVFHIFLFKQYRQNIDLHPAELPTTILTIILLLNPLQLFKLTILKDINLKHSY